MEPDAVEMRVLGCLIEKQHTTPDAYPLSLNSLRLACNQSTNREPVVDYDEQTVVEALRRLALRGWTRLASSSGSRARKYRHLLKDAFGLDDAEVSLLAVLMLRGPQTPGELKQRGQRLHDFADLAAVHDALARLVERGQVARHDRRPGQKEDRYEQLLGGTSLESAAASAAVADPGEQSPQAAEADSAEPAQELTPAEDRLTRLEREVTELRTELAALRADLGD
ncbi:MAG TPA: YceH family protein [Solirubrobacterales bacterium]|nr:YceH family protein [Solirubrobacterales bacterium]